MLRDFAIWWWQQLRSLLPARFGQQDERNTLFAEPVAAPGGSGWSAVVLSRQGRRGEHVLGRFTLDDAGLTTIRAAVRAAGRPHRVVLRVRRIGLLEQRVPLPLAAERSVGSVLLHDMDRLTPFRADEVFWTWTLERRDRAQARLHVRLTLIPRAMLDPLIRYLGDAGIAPVTLRALADDGSSRSLALAQAPMRSERTRLFSIRIAAVACGVLAVAVMAVPFVRQSLAIADTERRIATLQPGVSEAEALRRRIAGEATGANAVVAERARSGDAIAALAAVTEILPDSTFLVEFSLAQRQMTMTGQSREAALLIAALSSDPAIRNPSFTAPVTRSASSGTDLFSIRAELAP